MIALVLSHGTKNLILGVLAHGLKWEQSVWAGAYHPVASLSHVDPVPQRISP